MMIKNHKDFFAGLMFCAMGSAFAIGATNYNVGEGARMGPGYFPIMLGVILALMGVVIMLTGLGSRRVEAGRVGRWAWQPVGYILGANLLFGLALGGVPALHIPAMGLIVGIYALVLVSSLASNTFRLHKVLILATVLSIGSYLAFIVLLKLQIQVWPSFIG